MRECIFSAATHREVILIALLSWNDTRFQHLKEDICIAAIK